jgi:DNA-binding NarL/FixJ family response regulator
LETRVLMIDDMEKVKSKPSHRRGTRVRGNNAPLRRRGLTRRLTVCPISRHPGLATTMEQLLAAAGFKVLSVRLERGGYPGRYSSGGDGIEIERLPDAEVFVLDADSANPGTGPLIERIRGWYPRAWLLIVKETLKDDRVFPYLRLGVRGIVRYADAEKDLAKAVRAVAGGDFWVSREQLVRFVDWVLAAPAYRYTPIEPGALSRRERYVLTSILNGLTNKEIASELSISERTVKFHVSHLLQKLGANRRGDLIAKHYQLWPAAM